jgi:hypothetical protein
LHYSFFNQLSPKKVVSILVAKDFEYRFVIMTVLLLSSILVSSFSLVNASSEATIQDKSLSILNDVVNLNVVKYSTSLKQQQQDNFLTLPQQATTLTLTSNLGGFDTRFSYIDGNLRQLFISRETGGLSLRSKANNDVVEAEGFLQRYQIYCKDDFYGYLSTMLNNVEPHKNISFTKGNVRLDSTFLGSSSEFVWTFIDSNGVSAPVKNTALSYENGYFKSFTDNWQFYNIISEPKISQEQAINLALRAAVNFSYTTTDKSEKNIAISDVKVASVGQPTLCYLNYKNFSSARNGDPLTLYPSWYVPLGFDRIYPGGVSGGCVRFWADTGNISDMVPTIIDDDNISNTSSIINKANDKITANTPISASIFVPFTVVFLIVIAVISCAYLGKCRYYQYSVKRV